LVKAGSALSYEQFLSEWELVFQDFDRASDVGLVEFSMDDVCEAFLKRIVSTLPSTALVRQFRDVYLAEWNQGVKYLPGVPSLLCDLYEQYNLVLVTNTHHAELVREHLSQMDVAKYFSAVITSVEHGKKKPAPAIFAHALAVSGGTAGASVYVGDSFAADYQGAINVGMGCLLIDPTERFNIPQSARINSVLDVRLRLCSRRGD
jgi:putative hydrolase of the HAD superfamily